ncbi:hypothetical protein AX17_006108 [Amanita inopinata Kibby_2008]|nr:hypothetical protein AX17_006108 [Amanita inopinata Kibby_2008]
MPIQKLSKGASGAPIHLSMRGKLPPHIPPTELPNGEEAATSTNGMGPKQDFLDIAADIVPLETDKPLLPPVDSLSNDTLISDSPHQKGKGWVPGSLDLGHPHCAQVLGIPGNLQNINTSQSTHTSTRGWLGKHVEIIL